MKEFDTRDVQNIDYRIKVSFPKDKEFRRLARHIYRTRPFRIKAHNLRELRKKKSYLSKSIALIVIKQWGIKGLIILQDRILREQINAMEG